MRKGVQAGRQAERVARENAHVRASTQLSYKWNVACYMAMSCVRGVAHACKRREETKTRDGCERVQAKGKAEKQSRNKNKSMGRTMNAPNWQGERRQG